MLLQFVEKLKLRVVLLADNLGKFRLLFKVAVLCRILPSEMRIVGVRTEFLS